MMRDTRQKRVINKAHTKRFWIAHSIIAAMGILAIGIVFYSYYLGHRTNKVFTPLVHAAKEIQLEVTQAYLWYEEIMGGDEHTEIEVVWKHMDQAEWFTNAMLEGDHDGSDEYIPLNNRDMRAEIIVVKNGLSELKSMLDRRQSETDNNQPGSPIDKLFHDRFKSFLETTKGIERQLKKIMANDMRALKFTQTVLIHLSMILFAAALFVFSVFERRRTKLFIALEKFNNELEEQAAIQAKIEDNLKESERNFRLIAENVQDLFWINTPGMREFSYLSPAFKQIWGFNPEKFYHSPERFIETVHPEDRDLVLTKLKGHEQGEWNLEYRVIRPDNTVRWVQDRGVAVKDSNGNLVQMTGVARDITKIKLLESKLIQSEKMAAIGLMVSGMAHKINNPNNMISFNMPILRDYFEKIISLLDQYANTQDHIELFNMPYDEFRKEILNLIENIEHGADRVNRIVLDLKDFSKTKNRVKKRWVQIEPTIKNAVYLCRERIERAVHTIEVNISDDLPDVYTDPDIINTILINILNNAADSAHKENSWIRIDADVKPNDSLCEQLIINVADNGRGADDNSMELLFNPLTTSISSNTVTGLGLYLSHILADQIEAEIKLKSVAEQGSTFSLLITNPKRNPSHPS